MHAASNHFILSLLQQRIISAEMGADRLTVNDCAKSAAEIAHIIAFFALLDHEVIARQPEWLGVIQ